MKIISRIIVILLIAAIVAGGWYLAADNTPLASGLDNEGGRPSMTEASGQTFQPMERPDEGGEQGASISRGLAGVAGTLVKLAVITILVLLLQKGYSLLGNRKSPVSPPQALSQLRERQAGLVPRGRRTSSTMFLSH